MTSNNAVHPSVPLLTSNGEKTAAKAKGSKTSSSQQKKSKKPSNEGDNETSSRQAENLKWKTIRSEVLATFFASKKAKGDDSDAKKTFDKDVLRGITVRPSGKFQAQLYFGGRSRYIGVFNSEFDAASAYEMIRSRLKDDSKSGPLSQLKQDPKSEGSLSESPSSSTISEARDGKESKITKATALTAGTATTTTTMMRSITPSPTPRGNRRGEPTKVVSQA